MSNFKEKLKEKLIESVFSENGLNLTENEIRQEAERISLECGENVEDIFAEISDKKVEYELKTIKKLMKKIYNQYPTYKTFQAA